MKRNNTVKKESFFRDVAKNKFSYLIALPAIIYVFLFNYMAYPYMLIAFQRYDYRNNSIVDIIFKGKWVGFKNFNFFFSSQNAFRVTWNTIYLNVLFIITGTVMAVLLAILLNELRCKWFIKITQSVMLFPSYISWIMVSYILISLFSTQYGIVNTALRSMGMKAVNWYTDPNVWPGILVVMKIWKGAGMSAIIFLASITGIDSSLYEAAAIDGAGRFQMMKRITLPLIMPTIVIMTLLSLGKIMYGDFGMIYALVGDNGTLYKTTDIIDTYIFRSMRQIGDMSQSTAIGLFQSGIGFIMVYGSNWLARKFYPDGALY
ncbi:putative aldouronate transport system permease protein [Anaerocolumna jejuensis DSM 15929]|uniref:Putative aldouronate transport system permease protein n=1 Tax=Anaerocolumna jejuensis DSM 15929 TaxID=1121322 RepID=A0A1M6V0B9_9FIRM|nr:ABC transporter permease subunit [Anaerocolumna jejuensis]SHK74957.1 putative aldouronate transport system permease protein [Anaerocolumna jejuensis DSM 15929]